MQLTLFDTLFNTEQEKNARCALFHPSLLEFILASRVFQPKNERPFKFINTPWRPITIDDRLCWSRRRVANDDNSPLAHGSKSYEMGSSTSKLMPFSTMQDITVRRAIPFRDGASEPRAKHGQKHSLQHQVGIGVNFRCRCHIVILLRYRIHTHCHAISNGQLLHAAAKFVDIHNRAHPFS